MIQRLLNAIRRLVVIVRNRGEITWAPFNSVINSNQVLKELALEKERLERPVLLEDKINEIENYILNAFYDKLEITIKYYKNYQIYIFKGIITKIDKITKKITLNNKINIDFSNIVDFL